MLLSSGLTVAEAAAIINAAVVIVNLTFPLLIALVAVGILREPSNLPTWSVLGRLLNSSLWPTILRTDSVARKRVNGWVTGLSWTSALSLLLLGIVSAITPLGLRASLALTAPRSVTFQYAQDGSAFGKATLPHGDYVYNRVCGGWMTMNCPGNYDGFNHSNNLTKGTPDSGYYTWSNDNYTDPYISSRIPWNTTEIFTNATIDTTVASIFDIKYRTFTNHMNTTRPAVNESTPWIDQGRLRTKGRFQFYQSLILNDRLEAVEGLIVDTISGGIGFRNHTLPTGSGSETGSKWEEDILWLEPETQCVDLNMTLDYTLNSVSYSNVVNSRLTDRGGLVNLPIRYPLKDLNDLQGQDSPLLRERAWKAAVLTNMNLMRFFNETRVNTSLGKTYGLDRWSAVGISPSRIALAQHGSDMGPGLGLSLYDTHQNFSVFSNESSKYIDVGISSAAYAGQDITNISTISIAGGIMLGAARSADPSKSSPQRLDPGTNWTQSIYSCASAIKASIKRVSFHLNGTSQLANLNITNIKPINYTSTPPPTWAMENSNYTISDLNPLWGIVSPSHAASPSLFTHQSPHFYLPAGASSSWKMAVTSDGAAGAGAPQGTLAQIYQSIEAQTAAMPTPDYSGATSYPLFLKWQELSSTPETAGSIVDLIWTDVVANTLVGTKSVLSRNGTADAEAVDRAARLVFPAVVYDWRYAVPALVFVAVYVVLFFASVGMLVLKRVDLGIMTFMLNHSAAGRAVSTERFGVGYWDLVKTGPWADAFRDEKVRVGKDRVRGVGGYVPPSEQREHKPQFHVAGRGHDHSHSSVDGYQGGYRK